MIPRWLKIARNYRDKKIRELPGPNRDDPDIVEMLKATTLPSSLLHDETAWCAAFVCQCLELAGLKSTDSAAASSFLEWGKAIEYGRPGCVVMIPRDGGSGWHVGFYESENDEGVIVLGGNQSNTVRDKQFSWDRVEYFRWPTAKEGYIESLADLKKPAPQAPPKAPAPEAPTPASEIPAPEIPAHLEETWGGKLWKMLWNVLAR